MEKNAKAIIVVDMLNDFVTGSLAFPTAGPIVPIVRKFLEAARAKGLPVIYTNDAHRPGIDRELKLWPEHAVAGTPGARVIPELAPQADDYVVPKRRYSGFFATDLELLLRELKASTVIILGLYLPLCVRHTVGDAYNLGFDILVPADCVASISDEDYEPSLKYLKEVYGAELTTSAEILAEA